MNTYIKFLDFLDKVIDLLLSPRFKSFYWRTSMMALSAFVTLFTNSFTEIETSSEATVIIGLILGEISKHLNNKYGDIK